MKTSKQIKMIQIIFILITVFLVSFIIGAFLPNFTTQSPVHPDSATSNTHDLTLLSDAIPDNDKYRVVECDGVFAIQMYHSSKWKIIDGLAFKTFEEAKNIADASSKPIKSNEEFINRDWQPIEVIPEEKDPWYDVTPGLGHSLTYESFDEPAIKAYTDTIKRCIDTGAMIPNKKYIDDRYTRKQTFWFFCIGALINNILLILSFVVYQRIKNKK